MSSGPVKDTSSAALHHSPWLTLLPEPSPSLPPHPHPWKNCLHKTSSWCQKGWRTTLLGHGILRAILEFGVLNSITNSVAHNMFLFAVFLLLTFSPNVVPKVDLVTLRCLFIWWHKIWLNLTDFIFIILILENSYKDSDLGDWQYFVGIQSFFLEALNQRLCQLHPQTDDQTDNRSVCNHSHTEL